MFKEFKASRIVRACQPELEMIFYLKIDSRCTHFTVSGPVFLKYATSSGVYVYECGKGSERTKKKKNT